MARANETSRWLVTKHYGALLEAYRAGNERRQQSLAGLASAAEMEIGTVLLACNDTTPPVDSYEGLQITLDVALMCDPNILADVLRSIGRWSIREYVDSSPERRALTGATTSDEAIGWLNAVHNAEDVITPSIVAPMMTNGINLN